jgi:Na+/H+-dicarboxylate symporter
MLETILMIALAALAFAVTIGVTGGIIVVMALVVNSLKYRNKNG